MGSWDGTCGLSNLPIQMGNRVVCKIIGSHTYEDQTYASGICYTDDVWFDMTPPFKAEYYDCGTVHMIEETGVTDKIVTEFAKNLVPNNSFLKAGYKSEAVSMHKKLSERVFESVDDVIEELSWGHYLYKMKLFEDKPARYHPVGLWMAHEDVWNAYASSEIEVDYNVITKKSVSDTFDNLIESHKAIIELVGAEHGYSFIDIKVIGGINSLNATQSIKSFMPEIFDGVEYDLFIEQLMVGISMGLTRQALYPQAGRGSQSVNYALHQKLLNAKLSVARQKEKEYLIEQH